MKPSEFFFGIMRIPLDALGICAALILSYRLRTANIDLLPGINLLEPASTLPPLPIFVTYFILPSIAGFIALSACLSLYSLVTTTSAWREIGRILIVSALWLTGVMVWYVFVEKKLFYSRILLLHGVSLMALFVIILRGSVTLLQRWLLSMSIGVRTVVSVGQKPLTHGVESVLMHDPHYVYGGHRSDLQALRELMGSTEIDLVIQTDAHPDSEETVMLIDECRSRHIGYAYLPPVLADVPHLLQVDRIGVTPMMRLRPTPLDGWGRIGKRTFDIVAGCALLLLLIPLLLLISALITLTMGFPLFYVSLRVKTGGMRLIPVLKFRTMIRNADARKDVLLSLNHRQDGPLFKVRNDPRVTPVGRLLRRWSLDELPQLFNVIAGHMSLVGPRPHLPAEVSLYSPYQRRVFAVKPGGTGLAQISGRSDLTFQEEVALDLKYIEEWSPLFDLWILWRTMIVVLGRRGAD